LSRVCNVNKYYKQINEALIIISDVEMKIDDLYPDVKYVDDADHLAIEIWKFFW
jgi:hypothetical protein